MPATTVYRVALVLLFSILYVVHCCGFHVEQLYRDSERAVYRIVGSISNIIVDRISLKCLLVALKKEIRCPSLRDR